LNLAWTEALDLLNPVLVGELVTRSALERRESRGAHYRSDFPESDDAHWLRNVHLQCADDGTIRLWDEPVRFNHVTPPHLVTRVSV
jgi:succinate dehydrogenase/fumarate reductase flavoprotein subunit